MARRRARPQSALRAALQRAIARDPSEAARDLAYMMAERQRAERMQPRAAAKGRRA